MAQPVMHLDAFVHRIGIASAGRSSEIEPDDAIGRLGPSWREPGGVKSAHWSAPSGTWAGTVSTCYVPRMVQAKDGTTELNLVMRAVTRGQVADGELLSALLAARRFAIIKEALVSFDAELAEHDVGRALSAIRAALRRRLPTDAKDLLLDLGLAIDHAKVLFCVLNNMTISNAAESLELCDRVTASRWMKKAAPRLADWVERHDDRLLLLSQQDEFSRYLERLRDYCSELPPWFPGELRFNDILQEVTVIPPLAETPAQAVPPTGSTPSLERKAAPSGPRRLAWTAALQEFQRLVLVGEAGSGKSWAVKGRALALAEARLAGAIDVSIPILILAPKLEELLESNPPVSGDVEALTERLAAAIPGEIVTGSACVRMIGDLLRGQMAVEILIDGYDEVRNERPHLARYLDEIIRLLHPFEGRLVLTSRPSTLPQHQFAKMTATCELQPFAEREQRQFIRCWFGSDPGKAGAVLRWVSGQNLDILRKPLLIALFCAVAGTDDRVLPQTEHELWSRALRRLASDEDRYAQLHQSNEIVRLRLRILEEAAALFCSDTGLLDDLPLSQVTDSVRSLPEWLDLERISHHGTVIDDLLATGIVRRVTGRLEDGMAFLHSSVRDYLLAHALTRKGNWRRFVGRLWSQPEWGPVISHIGALSENADDVVLDLETLFPNDPLNTARFTAGQIVAAASDRIGRARRDAVRDELLMLLGSGDLIDQNRSVQLLASMQDDETAGLVRRLVDPSVPTYVLTSALRTIAGGTSAASRETLMSCIQSEEFTLTERKAAVDAMADTGTSDALKSLTALARDTGVDPPIRAAAAFSTFRLFDSADAAKRLLESNDGDSARARRLLAERLAQAEQAGSFSRSMFNDAFTIEDPYCRAVLLCGTSVEDLALSLTPALPNNPTVEWLAQVVEFTRTRLVDDPLMATCGRFILAAEEQAELRYRMATLIETSPESSATLHWRTLATEVPTRDFLEAAEFLVHELDRLPEDLSTELRRAIVADELGAVARSALQDRDTLLARSQTVERARDQAGSSDSTSSDKQVSLDVVLRSDLRLPVQYALMRALRRTIPADGPVREMASSLTHLLSTRDATLWIDALPTVAPRVDDRLWAASHHQEAGVELARLRSRWPDRHGEVAFSARTFSPLVLDARAEAALLADELDEAATLALASIGARLSESLPPTSLAVTVLFASGAGAGRTYSTHQQVRGYLPVLPQGTMATTTLRAWIQAAALDFRSVAQTVELMPMYALRADAEIAGLRMAAGLAGDEAFAHVISWSGCRRSAALLAGVAAFINSPTLLERIESARAVATLRAENLAREWPEIAVTSPIRRGAPRWQDLLLRIATRQLLAGRPGCAAAIYEAAVQEKPNDPTLVNNFGFCQIPLDTHAALETLDRAATLFTQPFGVNVANRMLLHLAHGSPAESDEIGEEYWQGGKLDRGTGYLWNMDAPSALEEDADITLYVAELGRRSALQLNDYGRVEAWENRIRLHTKDASLGEKNA